MMRRWCLVVMVGAAGLMARGAQVAGVGVGSIPDGAGEGPEQYGPTLEITFDASGMATGMPLTSIAVTIEHAFVGDLDARLVGPDGTEHVVFSQILQLSPNVGGDDSRLSGHYTFSDEATGTLWAAAAETAAGVAIAPGLYRCSAAGPGDGAATSLGAAFGHLGSNGVLGVWRLRVRDGWSEDIGAVTEAQLTFGGSGGSGGTTGATTGGASSGGSSGSSTGTSGSGGSAGTTDGGHGGTGTGMSTGTSSGTGSASGGGTGQGGDVGPWQIEWKRPRDGKRVRYSKARGLGAVRGRVTGLDRAIAEPVWVELELVREGQSNAVVPRTVVPAGKVAKRGKAKFRASRYGAGAEIEPGAVRLEGRAGIGLDAIWSLPTSVVFEIRATLR